MIVSGKYELLDLVTSSGVKTYRARHARLGNSVWLHLLEGGETEENVGILLNLKRIPESKQKLFIDAGEHERIPYLVTWPLPDFNNLADWLKREVQITSGAGEARRPAREPDLEDTVQMELPANPAELPREAEWPAPRPAFSFQIEAPAETAMHSTAPPEPPPPGQPGMDPVVGRSEIGAPSQASPFRPLPVAGLPSGDEPGEFTMFFQRGGAPPRESSPQPPSPAAPMSGGNQPGEFTLLFQGNAAPPREPPPAQPSHPEPPASRDDQPGEFTGMFGPLPPAAPPRPTPVAPPPQFQDEFQAQPKPLSPEAPSGTSEFNRLFDLPPAPAQPPLPQTPASYPASPPAGPPGDSAIFGAARPQAPPAPPSYPPPPPPAPTGPSEYTRILQAPPSPVPASPTPPAPAATPPGFQMPTPPAAPAGFKAPAPPAVPAGFKMPAPPQPPKAAVPELPKGAGSYLPLLLILGLLLLAVLIVVLIFVLKR